MKILIGIGIAHEEGVVSLASDKFSDLVVIKERRFHMHVPMCPHPTRQDLRSRDSSIEEGIQVQYK